MDKREKAREYARKYRERNREMLAAKERARHAELRAKAQPRPKPTDEERFWPKVKRDGHPRGCWEWQAGTAHGYGSFRWRGRSEAAHRVSWQLTRSAIPDGKHVLHHCDNPLCVNPYHLYIGTDAENARDRKERCAFQPSWDKAIAKRDPGWNKKRRDDDRRGGKPLLHEQDVLRIRSLHAGGMTMREIGRRMGITHNTVSRVVRSVPPYDSTAW
jgi:hypothetical protein